MLHRGKYSSFTQERIWPTYLLAKTTPSLPVSGAGEQAGQKRHLPNTAPVDHTEVGSPISPKVQLFAKMPAHFKH
jgi:hypothetical protein